MVGKCRVISAAVLCMKNQCNIEHFCLQLCILTAWPEHQQHILCERASLLRIADKQHLIFSEMTISMIGIYSYQRQLRNQAQCLPQYIACRNIFRVAVIRVKCQHTPLHGIHNICIGGFHNNIAHKTTTEALQFKQRIYKIVHLCFIGKFSK